MRVCFFSYVGFSPLTGTSVRTLNFARALAKTGEEVHIITQQSFEAGFDIHVHKAHFSLKRITFFCNMVKDLEIDVIHCGGYSACKLGVWVGKICRTPTVIDLHAALALDTREPRKIIMEKVFCRLADAVVVPTVELKRFYVSSGVRKDKIKVVRNCLDIEAFRKVELGNLRGKLGIPKSTFLLSFHGVLRNPYNIDALRYLSRIASEISKRVDDVKFLIVGGYGKEIPVENEMFIYTGYVDNLYSYLRIADLALVPLYIKSLGIRSRFPECFAAGLPVLTTPDGTTGVDFAVKEGAVKVGKTVKELADIAVELIENPKDLEKMRRACDKVLGKFEPKVVGEKLLEIYRSILG